MQHSINADARRGLAWGGLLVMAGMVLAMSGITTTGTGAAQADTQRVETLRSRLPISFEENVGQAGKGAESVRFLAKGSGYEFRFSPDRTRIGLTPGLPRPSRGAPLGALPASVIDMKLVDGDPAPVIQGESKLPGKVNYLVSRDPSKWFTDVPTYKAIRYRGIYQGIDLLYYGNGEVLEHDFVVRPGSDPQRIRIRYQGARKLSIDGEGGLRIHTPLGVVEQKKPISYQTIDGVRVPVISRYRLLDDDEVGFQLAGYRPDRDLVIDPVLRFSTFIGGSMDDYGFDIALDSDGNSYITGYTGSYTQAEDTDPGGLSPARPNIESLLAYPTQGPLMGDPDVGSITRDLDGMGGPESTWSYSRYDAFVTKLNPSGSGLVFSTYLGAESDDYGQAIAVDPSRAVYVTGRTTSVFWPLLFPVQGANGGGSDAFVVKLNSNGNAFLYSTYLGGSGADTGRAMEVDATGNAHIAGYTTSSDFPTFRAAQPTRGGGRDYFVTSLDASGSAYNYSTYLGGSADEGGTSAGLSTAAAAFSSAALEYLPEGTLLPYTSPSPGNFGGTAVPLGVDPGIGLAVDSIGNAFVAGGTRSTESSLNPFPVTAGVFQSTHGADAGGYDACVTKLDPFGAILFSTFLGGSADDAARAIAIDAQGNSFVTGYTLSGDFPLRFPLQGPQGSADAFVTKLDPAGTSLVYSTHLGGAGEDIGQGIAVSGGGQAYICGSTRSTAPTFPTVNYFQSNLVGATDVFVTKLRPDASGYEYSTYLGGGAAERALAIALDANAQAYITGIVCSTTFPRTLGAFQGALRTGSTSSFQNYAQTGFPIPFILSYPRADVFVSKFHAPPFAAANLTVTDVQLTSITLAWTDQSDNEDGFDIERKLGGAGSGSLFSVVGVVGRDLVTFQNTGLIPTTTYTYRVRPWNNDGVNTYYGPYSNQVTVQTLPEIPDAPSNFTAQPLDTTRIRLDWQDNSDNEDSFILERRDFPVGAFAVIATLPASNPATTTGGTITYVDTGLTPNTTYEYRVRSHNVAGDSALPHPTVRATTLPPAPTVAPVLTVTVISNSQIDLSWTYGVTPPDMVGFKIYRKGPADVSFSLLRTTIGSGLTFSDTGLLADSQYCYRVGAYNASGDGPLSAPAAGQCGTTLPNPPAQVRSLTAALLPPNGVRLNWSDDSTDENGFKVLRSIDNFTTSAVIAETGAGVTTYDDLGLARNTVYYYQIVAFKRNLSGDSDAPPSPVACAMTLPAGATGLSVTTPAAPAGVTALDLAWTDNNPAGTQSFFRIDTATVSGGPYNALTTVGPLAAGGPQSFQATGLTQNTQYFFRVMATNTAPTGCVGGGDSDSVSNEASGTTLPGAAGGLTVVPIPPTTNLRISFTDANAPASTSAHRIERSTDGVTFTAVITLPAGTTTYDDNDLGVNLAGNRIYFYRVIAVNPGGDGASSAVVNQLTLPARPTGLTADASAGGNPRRGRTQIDLTWVDNSFPSHPFRIERSPDGVSNWVVVGTTGPGATTFTDTGLTENTQYCYRVHGFNGSGNGDISTPPVCRTTLHVPPGPPTGLTATVISMTQINLTWEDNSSTEDGYRIYRKIGLGAYALLVDNLPPNTVAYSDMGLTPDTTYTYQVFAFNNGGESLGSREAGGTTLKAPPAAPTGLSATALTASSIRLDWTDNATTETAFEIDRSTDGGATFPNRRTISASPGTGAVSVTDTALEANRTYTYRVRAVNNNQSAWSNQAGALTFPASPTGLTASAVSASRVDLAWTDNNGAFPSLHRIERKVAGGGYGLLQDDVPAGTTTFSDLTVAPDTTYVYRVIAKNATGLSAAFSNEATAVTPPLPPAAPSGLTATVISATQIDLQFTDNAVNETQFEVERSRDNVSYQRVYTLGASAGTGATVNVSDRGLSSNTLYFYRVRAVNTGGNSAYEGPVNATTLPLPPGSPFGLGLSGITQTQIVLTWTDGSDNEAEFLVERRTGLGAFGQVAIVAAQPGSGGQVQHTDAGLTANTSYTYRVRARNAGGFSSYSNEATGTTLPNPPNPPLNATATALSQTSIRVNWVDNSNNETGFQVERSLDGVNFTVRGALGAGVTSFTDTGLTKDTEYHYRILATNTGGASAPSNVATTRTFPDKPAAPNNLSVATVSASAIDLTWNDLSNNETGFRIERKTGAGTFGVVATVGADVTTYRDNGLAAETAYTYRVRSTNAAGDSLPSNEATTTTLPNPPAAPSNLTVTLPPPGGGNAPDPKSLVLSWQDNSSNETGFQVFRRTGAGGYSLITTTGANVTGFTDTGLSAATTYTYKIRSVNAGGASGDSNEASATTPPARPGAAPTNLTATTVSRTAIDLTWSDQSNDEDGFRIEVSLGGGPFSAIRDTVANDTAETIDGLQPATTYTFRVRAFNTGGVSDPSNTASATTLPNVPAAPSGLAVNTPAPPDGRSQLVLNWTDNSDNEGGFRIERRQGAGVFTEVGRVGPNVTTFTNQTGLSVSTTYDYRVFAFNPGGDSNASNIAAGTTLRQPPAAPSNLQVMALDTSTLRLDWQDNSDDEDGFQIQRKQGKAFVNLAQVGAGVRTFNHTGLAPGSVETYRVMAFNNGGSSAPSNEASGVTPPSGRIKITPPALSFGRTRSGQVSQRSLVIKNVGTGELGVSITDPKGPFSIVSPAERQLMIAPGKSVKIVVQFSPTKNGPARGDLVIRSTDSRRPIATVSLSGNGIGF